MFPLFYLLTLIFIKNCESLPVTTPKNKTSLDIFTVLNLTDYNITTHLQFEFIKKICNNRDICKSNDTKLCAVRKNYETFEFKDFENSCFLFLSNMCDYPGNEFHIVAGTNCSVVSRRHYEPSGVDMNMDAPFLNVTPSKTSHVLRGLNVTRYPVERCPDRHVCAPITCPPLYKPACMKINHNTASLNPKTLTFVNHCVMDQFFCEHYNEFEKTINQKTKPKVSVSDLNMTFCSGQRYLNFLFTSKGASSLGHYGWLDGNDRYSKILEPFERKDNYG